MGRMQREVIFPETGTSKVNPMVDYLACQSVKCCVRPKEERRSDTNQANRVSFLSHHNR